MRAFLTTILVLSLTMLLGGCPDQFSTTPVNPGDDDDDDDDDSADDDVADDDDDDQVTVQDVQAALDRILEWPTHDGCSQVTVYGANGSQTVELKVTANVDLASESMPFNENYDLPGPGALLSLRSGQQMGTAICTASPGSPQVQDNYSVQGGTQRLVLDRTPPNAPLDQTTALVTFQGIQFERVGGSETVTLPDVTLPAVQVGWEP